MSPLSPPWFMTFVNPRGISASRIMTSRLVIKFPTLYGWWSNSLPPGQEKASNARGMPGGMLKLRFHWYITPANCLSQEIKIIPAHIRQANIRGMNTIVVIFNIDTMSFEFKLAFFFRSCRRVLKTLSCRKININLQFWFYGYQHPPSQYLGTHQLQM